MPPRIRLRPDSHPRHAGRGRQVAGLPRHHGHSLFVVLDDLVGHHLRQDFDQARRRRHGRRAGARTVHPPRRRRRSRRTRGRTGTAALRQAQRLGQQLRRDARRTSRRNSRRRRTRLRRERRSARRGVHPRPRNGLRRTDRRRQGIPAPDHGDPAEKGILRFPGQIRGGLFGRDHAGRDRTADRGRTPPSRTGGLQGLPLPGHRARGFHRHARRPSLPDRDQHHSRHERRQHRTQAGARRKP